MKTRLIRVLHTVRHLTLRQWCFRLIHIIRQIRYKILPVHQMKNTVYQPVHPGFVKNLPYDQAVVMRADRILANEFDILGNMVSFPQQIDWKMQGNHYRLRLFRLNSFDFLLALSDAYAMTGNECYLEKGFDLIKDWWRQNGRFATGDQWNGFVVAQRLINWISFFSFHGSLVQGGSDILAWIVSQSWFLNRNIEYHLGANHLLMEAKALVYCGVFLMNQHLCGKGIRLMQKEIRQFLADGGHCERSMSYQIEAMQHVFETAMVLDTYQKQQAMCFVDFLARPFIFLQQAMMPNQKIFLVNDSSEEYPMEAAEWMRCARLFEPFVTHDVHNDGYAGRWIPKDWKPRRIPSDALSMCSLQPNTGYVFYKEITAFGQQYWFMDAGENGPAYNQGHAHADALSIGWTADQQPILIDSGVFTYEPGEKRDYYRGTKAHNTIMIDDQNSSDVWGAFRMGKRSHTTIKRYEEDTRHLICQAVHDGYCKYGADRIWHERTWLIQKQKGWTIVLDRLFGRIHSTHRAAGRFHLHPDCALELKENGETIINEKYHIRCSRPLIAEEYPVSFRFNQETQATCLAFNFDFNRSADVMTIFEWGGMPSITPLDNDQYEVDQEWML